MSLYCIYKLWPEQIVLEVEGDRVVKEFKTPFPTGWSYGEPKGGTTPLDFKGKWIRFFHSRYHYDGRRDQFRYFIGACVMEKTPPFQVLTLSKTPILAGHEWRHPGVHHWKPNVMIAYGAMPWNEGFMLSVGCNDAAACTCFVTEKQLRLP